MEKIIYCYYVKKENQIEITKDFVPRGIVEGDIIEVEEMTMDYTILSN